MRLVYAHFPINANAEKSGEELSIRNFLGEKIVRSIPMCEGVKVAKDLDVKDQLLFEGNSIENVSRYAPAFHTLQAPINMCGVVSTHLFGAVRL